MQRLLTAFFLIIIIASSTALSQNYADKPYDPRPVYGLFGNFNYNLHTADFKNLSNCPSCNPGYSSGGGIGYNFGFLYGFPISKLFELEFRAAYFNLSGKLTKTETTTVFNPTTNQSEPGEFEHSVDSKINSVALSPLLNYRISDQFKLHFGARAGFVLTKTFVQQEEIISPSYGVFTTTHQRIQNKYTDDITDAATIEAAVIVGASYDFPLNSAYTLFLSPEAFLTYGITPIAKDLTWNINTIHGGIALKYAPRKIIPPKPPPPPPPPPPLPPPPPPPSAPVLDANILAVGVENDGKETSVSTLRVEAFLFTRMHPILNYVFFEENSDNLPGRYTTMNIEDKKNFSVKNLYNLKTMEVYYQVLNIVGKRMSYYPQAQVTLIGCNSNSGDEKGNTDLSRRRAQAVKDYLVKAWDIPQERITIQSRNLPEIPSNIATDDGNQENRRVEIVANLPQVFEPMIIRDTLREANPPHIRFKTKINTPIGVNNWRIITMQNEKSLRTFQGPNQPPANLDWDLKKEDEQKFIPQFTEPLNYKLEIVDNDNKTWESNTQVLPVDQMTIERKMLEMIEDKEIDKFSLILFAYNSATLSKENLSIVDFAKKRIQKESTVSITGYTDRSGEEQLNLNLSQRRADATAKSLGVDQKFAKGVGKSTLLYDNSTPEGRFYCRTVNIEIVTPIK